MLCWTPEAQNDVHTADMMWAVNDLKYTHWSAAATLRNMFAAQASFEYGRLNCTVEVVLISANLQQDYSLSKILYTVTQACTSDICYIILFILCFAY